jgi:hypothetical protein
MQFTEMRPASGLRGAISAQDCSADAQTLTPVSEHDDPMRRMPGTCSLMPISEKSP